MDLGIHGQVQLAPDSALFLTILALFPFALAKHLQASGIDSKVSNSALAGQAIADVDRFGSLADATVTGQGQR